MELTNSLAWDIFCWGVDYGQLTMERERENEEWFDAFNGYFVARKTTMPANPVLRRQLHSEKWFEAKKKSYDDFIEFLTKLRA